MPDNSFHHYFVYDTSTQPEFPKYEFGAMEIKSHKLIKKENKLEKEEWVKTYKQAIDQLSISICLHYKLALDHTIVFNSKTDQIGRQNSIFI